MNRLPQLLCLACLPLVLSTVSAAESASAKPRVLILGDSISIGYTPFVREMLKDEAVVVRPTNAKGAPDNCGDTARGIKSIDRWLQAEGGKWDVIHFNFGLHDLKRVEPDTNAAPSTSSLPHQVEPDIYEKQLREIVARLKTTGARLIWATTPPVPKADMKPRREVEDVARYNEIAARVMRENQVAVDDLYAFALPQLDRIQRSKNVHFTDPGYKALAGEVVRQIRLSQAAKPVPAAR